MQLTKELSKTTSKFFAEKTLNSNHGELLNTNGISSPLIQTQNLFNFFKELNEYAERAFGDQAHEMTDIFLYAKRPPHCERIFNLAYLQDGTRDQIVANLDKELELGGIENDGKLRIPTMLITAAKDNANKPNNSKIYCLYWKKLGHLNKNCRKRIRKEQEQKQDRAQNVKRFRAKAYSP